MSTILERLAAINGELREKRNINIPNININQKYMIVQDDRCKIELSYKTIILYRIRSLKDFGDVKANTLGGFVESYNNLSQEGDCWIYNNAKVYGNSVIKDNAKIKDLAKVIDSLVRGNAIVNGKARVEDKSRVFDNAFVSDEAVIDNGSIISGNVRIINNTFANRVIVSGDKTYGLEQCSICGNYGCGHVFSLGNGV